MAETVLDRFVTEFIFKGDTRALAGVERGINNVRKRIDGVSRGMTIAGAGLTGALIGVGATVYNFEQEINTLQAATNATAEDMAKMRGQAIELGRSTQFSASQAASAQKLLGQAGLDTNQIIAAMPGVLNLAAAGNLDMARAADITTSTLAGFQLEAEQTGRVGDVLAAAASNAKTTVSEMGEAITGAAPLANALGISLEDTAAAVALLQNNGIQAAESGIGFRNMLIRMLNISGPAEDALEEGLAKGMKKLAEQMKLGGEAGEQAKTQLQSLQGAIDKGLGPTLKKLAAEGKWEEALRQLKAAGIEADAMTTIFGARAANMALILGNNLDKLDQLQGVTQNAAGEATRMAEAMMQGIVGAWKQIISRTETLMIALGDAGLTKIIIKLLDTGTMLIDKFLELSPPIKTAVAAIIGAGPALLAVGFALKFLSIGLGGLIPLMKAYAFAVSFAGKIMGVFALITKVATGSVSVFGLALKAAGIGIILTLITAAVMAAIYVFKNWEDVVAYVKKGWDAVNNYLGGALAPLLQWVERIQAIWKRFTSLFEKSIVRNPLGLFERTGEPPIFGIIRNAWNKTMKFLNISPTGIFDWIRNAWNTATTWIKGAWQTVRNAITLISPGVFDWIRNAWNTVTTWIKGAWKSVMKFTGTITTGIFDWIRDAWGATTRWIRSTWQTVKKFIGTITPGVFDWIRNAWNTTTTWIKATWQAVRNFIGTATKGIFDWIRNAWESTTKRIQNTWNQFTEWIRNTTNLQSLFDGLKQGFAKTIEIARNIWILWTNDLLAFWHRFVGRFQTAWQVLKAAFGEFLGLFTGLRSLQIDSLIGGDTSFAEGLKKIFAGMEPIIMRAAEAISWLRVTMLEIIGGAILARIYGLALALRGIVVIVRGIGEIAAWLQGTWDRVITHIATRFTGAWKELSKTWNEFIALFSGEGTGETWKVLGNILLWVGKILGWLLLQAIRLIADTLIVGIKTVTFLLKAIVKTVQFVGKAFKWLGNVWNEVMDLFERDPYGIFGWISRAWGAVLDWFKGPGEDQTIYEWLSEPIVGLWNWIKNIWKGVTEYISTKKEDLYNWLDEKRENLFAWVEEKWKAVTDYISTKVEGIFNWIQEAWESILEWFKGPGENQTIYEWLSEPIVGLWNWIKNLWDDVKAHISKIAPLFAWLNEPMENLFGWIKEKWDGIKTYIGTKAEGVYNWLDEKREYLFAWVEEKWKAVTDYISTKVEGIFNWIQEAWESILERFKGPEDNQSIWDWLMTPIVGLFDWIKNLWDDVKVYISQAAAVFAWLNQPTGNLFGWIKEKWDGVKSYIGKKTEGATNWIGEKKDGAFDWAKEQWKGALDYFGKDQEGIFGWLKGIGLTSIFDPIMKAWEAVTRLLASPINGLFDWIGGIWNGILNSLTSGWWKTIADLVDKLPSFLTRLLPEDFLNKLEQIREVGVTGLTAPLPVAPDTAASITNETNQNASNQTQNIRIEGISISVENGDPVTISREIGNALREELVQTVNANDSIEDL